jgi:hypothetical protein
MLSFLVVLIVLVAPAAARAEKPRAGIIIFKDGFSLEGYVIREEKTYFDSSTGEAIKLQEGFFLLDDAVRSIIFSPAQLQKVDEDPTFAPDKGSLDMFVPGDFTFAKPLPPIRGVVEAGDWNDHWDRTYKYDTTSRQVILKQHLQRLCPHYARIDAVPRIVDGALKQYKLASYYLTRELGPDQLRTLLAYHKDLKETGDLSDEEKATRRVKIAQFLLQCGWYATAEQEAQRLAKDLPCQKSKADSLLESVKQLRAIEQAQDIRAALKAGRYGWAEKHLPDLATDGVPEETLADLRALRSQYETSADNLKQARRFLEELPATVADSGQRPLFDEAAAAIRADLHPDNVARLETFLGQAQQAERQRKAGQKPGATPAQLLSMAVSSWVLGNTAAEDKVEVAQRLWLTRRFVLEYQRTRSAGDREQLRKAYESRKGGVVPLDEMARLIALLPPPDAETNLAGGTRTMKAPAESVPYLLQLPSDYSHGRPYPVLLVLHHEGEKAHDMLERWSNLAEKNGYILAAPEWLPGFRAPEDFTYREHAAVLATLQDLRRRFQVDSDRIFLAGYGKGGDLAYEVGLSHPDLFAGVIPIAAFPGSFPYHYRHNGQYLPFYVVNGDRSGDSGDNKAMFREWVPHSYPVIYVRYKGRGLEWFAEEVPNMFDWMGRKKRAHPVTEVGRPGGQVGDEFVTTRPTDNHFYWLTAEKIRDNQINNGARWDARILGATLQANRGGNHINVRLQAIEEVTVWFPSGDGATDFDKPVNIWVNTGLRYSSKVTPSLETMLEDLYDRCDRQQLYVASVRLRP